MLTTKVSWPIRSGTGSSQRPEQGISSAPSRLSTIFKRAALAADGPGADARPLQASLFTCKVVIEGDRAVQVGQGDAQLLADGFDRRGPEMNPSRL